MLNLKPKYQERKETQYLECVILLFGNLKLIKNSCSNLSNLPPILQNTHHVVFSATGLGLKFGEFAFESALSLTGCMTWGKLHSEVFLVFNTWRKCLLPEVALRIK